MNTHHSRRSRQRGAALVEAAFMFPLLVILWFACVYAHSLYAAKLKVNAEARAEAWGYAMANCGKQGDPSNTETPADAHASVVDPGTGSIPFRQLLGGGGGKILDAAAALLASLPIFGSPGGAESEKKDTVNFRIPNEYAHTEVKGDKSVVAKVVVFCNEAPHNGDLAGVVKTLWDMVRPW